MSPGATVRVVPAGTWVEGRLDPTRQHEDETGRWWATVRYDVVRDGFRHTQMGGFDHDRGMDPHDLGTPHRRSLADSSQSASRLDLRVLRQSPLRPEVDPTQLASDGPYLSATQRCASPRPR